MHQQAALDEARGFLAHVDRGNFALGGQGAPVVIGKPFGVVTGDEAHRGIAPAFGQALTDVAQRAEAAVMPGTMPKTVWASSASISSSRRPKTVGSPAFSRTT